LIIIISLDAIFDDIVTIDKTPRSIINVRLIISPDNKDIFEVIDIEGLNSIAIKGLKDANFLEISSPVRRVELQGLEKKNKQIKFIVVKESV